MMELRNEAQCMAARSGSQEDWREYRGLRNKCVDSQKMDKKNWEKRKLNSKENSPSQLLKSVKAIICWGSTGPPTKLYHKGEYVCTPAGLATTMDKFFIEKVNNLQNAIPLVNYDPLTSLWKSMNNRQCTFRMKQVNEEEVIKIITSMKNSSSTGSDLIDAQTIKLVKHEIARAVTNIINLIIETATFPVSYKRSQIIPLKKKSNHERPQLQQLLSS